MRPHGRRHKGLKRVDGPPIIFRPGSWPPKILGTSKWFLIDNLLPTALAGKVKQSVASICPLVCPSVCFHSMLWTDWPLNWSLCVWVMTITRLGLKVNVIVLGQRSMSSAYGRGNAVTRFVWPRSSIEDSFSSYEIVLVSLRVSIGLVTANAVFSDFWERNPIPRLTCRDSEIS